MRKHEGPPIYVVYDHPRDFPDRYVCRRQWACADGTIECDKEAMASTELEPIRVALRALGLTCVGRHPDDDAVIVETWL